MSGTDQKNHCPSKSRAGTPNEAVLRVSFLEQAATLLASQQNTSATAVVKIAKQNVPSAENGTQQLLGRLFLRELRECAFVDQLRMQREFKRSHCRRCFQSWISYGTNKCDIQIKVKRRLNSISRICKQCGKERWFVTNPNYQSRNEKARNLT